MSAESRDLSFVVMLVSDVEMFTPQRSSFAAVTSAGSQWLDRSHVRFIAFQKKNPKPLNP